MSDLGDDSYANGDVDEQKWHGATMEEIYRYLNPFELEHVPPVRPSDSHTVLYHYPIRTAATETPRPLRGHQRWDSDHVRLPCSTKSQYPVTADDGNVSIESRWEMIEKALLRSISNSHELESAILSYNTKYKDQWKFRALHKLFEDELDESEARVFFEDLLPRIIRLALRLPDLVQTAIPLLKQGQTRSISMTQEQVACLLANGFLCTFPRRNTLKRKSEYSTFPDINFNRLFQSTGHHILEKIKCICHYFRRVCPTERDSSNVPTGTVTFLRRSMHHSDMPNWSECQAPVGAIPLHITPDGTIEDQGLGLLQVDFANKFIGGGVLGSGCVQEEIRFVICPELLVSKLFTECLRPTEALHMIGCERYSNYTGYASSFLWAGNHEDLTPRDTSRRRQSNIVAIDALALGQASHQYREELMVRELNKAYVGFYHSLETPAPGVASGNWGCGAFGGDATLKALLQLIACTQTQRPLVYYTFGDEELCDDIYKMYNFLRTQNVKVCDLWATLKKFNSQRLAAKELYNFIYSCHGENQMKTATATTNSEHNRRPQLSQTRSSISSNSAFKLKEKPSQEASSVSISPTKRNVEKCSEKRNNLSQDLFATSPSSEDENEERSLNTAVSSKSSQASNRIVISDDSEADALLLAVEIGETTAKVEDIKLPASTSTSPTAKNRPQPRQRTLLEMLDQCYKDNSSPAKRPKS